MIETKPRGICHHCGREVALSEYVDRYGWHWMRRHGCPMDKARATVPPKVGVS